MRCRRNLHVPKPRSPGPNIPHHRGPAQGFQGISYPELGKPWTLEQSSRHCKNVVSKVIYRSFFAKYSWLTHWVKLKHSGLQL
jgi:hypothetical protein